jgi:hypothetical protein
MPASKLPTPRPLRARNGDVLLLVGTMKGLFLLRSNASRRRWDITGPFFPGGPDNIRDARGLATAVPPGVEIVILPAVSGG